MTQPNDADLAAVKAFLEPVFGNQFKPTGVTKAEKALIEQILAFVSDRFEKLKYVLGLAIDFTVLAQKLGSYDPNARKYRPDMSIAALFERYPPVAAKGKANVNTLTLTFMDQDRLKRLGIRGIEEQVCDLFTAADRTGYPSAYVYNTGMWRHYEQLLVDCFKLSESGRFLLCQRLIDFGLSRLPRNTFFGRGVPRPRLFEQLVREFPRASSKTENAGMVFQAIAYGFFKADRPHLSLIVDKSRTGSARQRRFGDIDAYYGLDLEIAIEVKDEAISQARVASELGQFAKDVHRHQVRGIAFVESIEPAAREWLASFGVYAQDIDETLSCVGNWDWHKQDDAVNGALHFISHVEQRPEAVTRMLEFISKRDASHASLAYLE